MYKTPSFSSKNCAPPRTEFGDKQSHSAARLLPCLLVIGPGLTQKTAQHLLYHPHHFLVQLGFSWKVSMEI